MYKKIMVPLDGSALAECVLPHVEAIGKGCGAEKIILVRVVKNVEPPPTAKIRFTDKDIKEFVSDKVAFAKEYLDKMVARLHYDWTQIESRVLVGHISMQLVDFSKQNDMDLIIIATHGRSGIGSWVWGTTADRVLRTSKAPVLIVRGPGVVPETA
jgi:nucleotide-binding universal stress UspA family protein